MPLSPPERLAALVGTMIHAGDVRGLLALSVPAEVIE